MKLEYVMQSFSYGLNCFAEFGIISVVQPWVFTVPTDTHNRIEARSIHSWDCQYLEALINDALVIVTISSAPWSR